MVVVTLTRRSSFFVRQVVEVVAAVVLEVLVAVIAEEVVAMVVEEVREPIKNVLGEFVR